MKILIAVISHRAGRKQRELIRATLNKVVGMDVRFFVGNGAEDADDCVGLDCDDSYEGLPSKIKAIARYAVEHDYDYLVKCDDDVILDPDALLKTGFWEYDFTGTIDPEVGLECPFGFLYTLSWDACGALAMAPLTDCTEENMWVTEALRVYGIDVTPLQYGSLVFEDKRQVFGTAAVCIHGRPEWKPGAFLMGVPVGCPCPTIAVVHETWTGFLNKDYTPLINHTSSLYLFTILPQPYPCPIPALIPTTLFPATSLCPRREVTTLFPWG